MNAYDSGGNQDSKFSDLLTRVHELGKENRHAGSYRRR